MKLCNPVHPSEIILEYILNNDNSIYEDKVNLLKLLILNRTNIDERTAMILAEIFKTSIDFWLNLQKQYDDAQEKPLNYVPKTTLLPFSAINNVLKTGEAYYTYLNGNEPKEDEKVVVLSTKAFEYLMLNKTQDEFWDLDFFGASAEHAVSKGMPKKLKELLGKK